MRKGEQSKRKILLVAFKLFATRPYEAVSFKVLETEIGISRGSMIYYFKNKEGLFKEILKTFFFASSSVKSVPEAYRLSLYSFFSYFIETLKKEKQNLKVIGIENLNEALMRIENSALTYIENFKDIAYSWFEEETEIWHCVLEKSIRSGEISSNIDPKVYAGIFELCYLGKSFTGVFTKTGYDIDKLENYFQSLYNSIKINN